MRQVRGNFKDRALDVAELPDWQRRGGLGAHRDQSRRPAKRATSRRVLRRMGQLDPVKAENLVNSVLTGGKVSHSAPSPGPPVAREQPEHHRLSPRSSG